VLRTGVRGIISKEDYNKLVEESTEKAFHRKSFRAKGDLYSKMQDYSKKLMFEEAAK